VASYRAEDFCIELRVSLDQSMAITNHERVGKALEQLNTGLRPFVERELKATYKERWVETARPSFPNWQQTGKNAKDLNWDTQALLGVMWDLWNDCFRKILGPSDRSLVSELRDVRNKWAHQKAFSTDDAYRAIDTISRLLTAVAAPEVEQVDQMKAETLRVKFDEQVRSQKRKESSIAVEGKPAAGLRPWREVVTPHPDVASGRYQQAEFAADLWQVFLGEGSDEYRDPVEFYRRTFITEGLQKLLSNALLRLAGQGGDPVVELQTNFGGGKTHSMLALYHLFANVPARRQSNLSRRPSQEAGWYRGAHALGRTGLATRWQRGLRDGPHRRRERCQSRRFIAVALQEVFAVPHFD
jgi:hypothetical protein